jgi:hypothetical protein
MQEESGYHEPWNTENEFTASGWPKGEEPPEKVKEILRRTVEFLAQCSKDPQAAMSSQDPKDLIVGLEEILRETPAPPSIPIRRRRSA